MWCTRHSFPHFCCVTELPLDNLGLLACTLAVFQHHHCSGLCMSLHTPAMSSSATQYGHTCLHTCLNICCVPVPTLGCSHAWWPIQMFLYMSPLLVQQHDSIDMPFCMPATSQCRPSAHLNTHVQASIMSPWMTHGGLGSMPLSHTCLLCPRVTMWWCGSGCLQ